MKKVLLSITLAITIFTQFALAIPDFTKIVPPPSKTVKDWVQEDSNNRKTITTVLQVAGGVLFVAGVLVQNDPQGGTMLKIAGGVVYLISFVTNIKGNVEVKGQEILDMPDKTAKDKFDKEAIAGDFILSQGEDEKIKKFADTSREVVTTKKVDIDDVLNVALETRGEKAARRIREQLEKN